MVQCQLSLCDCLVMVVRDLWGSLQFAMCLKVGHPSCFRRASRSYPSARLSQATYSTPFNRPRVRLLASLADAVSSVSEDVSPERLPLPFPTAVSPPYTTRPPSTGPVA